MDQSCYCRNGHITDVLLHSTIPIKIPVRLFPGMGGGGPKCKQKFPDSQSNAKQREAMLQR